MRDCFPSGLGTQCRATKGGCDELAEDTREVDCSRGDSINEALGKQNPGRALAVVIRGSCAEAVTIGRDDITLQGNGGAITGGVTVNGAQRAVIAGLSITNPVGNGITITNGASVTNQGNELNDSSGYGIFVRNGSLAIVNDTGCCVTASSIRAMWMRAGSA